MIKSKSDNRKKFQEIATFWNMTEEQLAKHIIDTWDEKGWHMGPARSVNKLLDNSIVMKWFVLASEDNPENTKCGVCNNLNVNFDDAGFWYYGKTLTPECGCIIRPPHTGER